MPTPTRSPRCPPSRGAALGLGCALAVWLAGLAGLLRGPDDALIDAFFRLRGVRPTHTPVVLVSLEDACVASLGKQPHEVGSFLAEVVPYLRAQGAAAVGIDIPTAEDRPSDPGLPWPDGLVVARRRSEERRPPALPWRPRAAPDAADHGFADLTEEEDHRVRRQKLVFGDGDLSVPHFALAVYAASRGETIDTDAGRNEVRVGGRAIPVDAGRHLRINYLGPPGTFRPLPFRDVLAAAREGRPLPEVRGAVVLVGVTARDQQDFHATPYTGHRAHGANAMTGLELQANVLATLGDGAFLRSAPWPVGLAFLLAVGAALGAVVTRLGWGWGAVAAVVVMASWLAAVWAAFCLASWRVAPTGVLLADALILAGSVSLRVWRRRAVDPPVPATVLERPGGPALPAPAGYVIEAELGRGGMGVVYRAHQAGLRRTVALKVLLGEPRPGAEELARFRAEAEALARVQHRHVVQVFEAGEWPTPAGPVPYFAMEFMAGGSLTARLGGRPLPPADAAALLVAMARAVRHAHRRGVLHRDLKPANVLFAADGTPKLADFGLAKVLDADGGLTRPGAVLGTPAYLAPELARGGAAATAAADVYGLGAILYECLTGRPPFQGGTVLEVLDRVRFAEPVPVRRLCPGVPAALERVCLRCLEKDPGRRYPSAAALLRALARARDGGRHVSF
jgi:CHASE2 domain-containing sensor protein